MDGENAPFWEKNEDDAEEPAAADDCYKDWADAEENIQENMKKRTQGVAGFANKNVICHIIYIIAWKLSVT